MAAKRPAGSWTEEVVCPICKDFFTDPVALDCGHNFCRSCITQSWDREGRNSCPECREESANRTLRVNRALVRLSEKARTLSMNLKAKKSKLQCEKHQEELKLFCKTDKKLICLICATGQQHRSHSLMLIEEAIEFYKEQVKSSFESLTEKESEIQKMEQEQKESISGVQEESHNLQSQITSQFAELHQILTVKEQRLLSDVREEEEKIVKSMEKNLQGIQENLKSIQEELSKLQEQTNHKNGLIFLKEEAGRKSRVSDETKPMLVVYGAFPIEKYDCNLHYKIELSEASDIKQDSLVRGESFLYCTESSPLSPLQSSPPAGQSCPAGVGNKSSCLSLDTFSLGGEEQGSRPETSHIPSLHRCCLTRSVSPAFGATKRKWGSR
ncbi:zinc-binding protein A33-like isoform X4 [Leucoraja erinacea]|uniref:zinc-binding protein A33-like isoform X4 n=1 Tax=Leucoraja erinaceus TaxID=7782 RepID=UPI002454314D|nr:zinc-binding protein A33-like isoform X4 [Leucoraja erinacea]